MQSDTVYAAIRTPTVARTPLKHPNKFQLIESLPFSESWGTNLAAHLPQQSVLSTDASNALGNIR
jgi:hypothetical protein